MKESSSYIGGNGFVAVSFVGAIIYGADETI
jgi:hypothetical protein